VSAPRRIAIVLAGFLLLALAMEGCSSASKTRQAVPSSERLRVGILPFRMEAPVTKLSNIKSLLDPVAPDQEPALLAEAVARIPKEARRLFYDRVEQESQFDLIPLESFDAAVAQLGLSATYPVTTAQLCALRDALNADVFVSGAVLDYGKVRWQWSAAGMMADMTWESVAIGLATAWNPAAIMANVGFELLTSTPLWFGGAYVFGLAFRPVRVEPR